jgi:alkylhydroperoxidase/carboxymuconolactone decarboxylase family protein YurZ
MERREFLKSGALGLGGFAMASAMVSTASAEGGESTQTKAIDKIMEWEPEWAEQYIKLSTNPWENGILDTKSIELICVGINAASTNLQAEPTRRHIRAALEAGATRDEIMLVLKGVGLMAIHSSSLGAPILLEEAKAAGAVPSVKEGATPVTDAMKAANNWNPAWDPFFELDPTWTDQFFGAVADLYNGRVLPPKFIELLSIAADASVTHMYAPGTRRHIKSALALGATVDEINETLKIAVSFGGESTLNMAVPILAEELAVFEKK